MIRTLQRSIPLTVGLDPVESMGAYIGKSAQITLKILHYHRETSYFFGDKITIIRQIALKTYALPSLKKDRVLL